MTKVIKKIFCFVSAAFIVTSCANNTTSSMPNILASSSLSSQNSAQFSSNFSSQSASSLSSKHDNLSVTFFTYPFKENYTQPADYPSGSHVAYVTLDLNLPHLEGTYPGISKINEQLNALKDYYYAQLPFDFFTEMDVLEQMGIDQKDINVGFISADYKLSVKIDKVISMYADCDGGALGVPWDHLESSTYNLDTGELLELNDLFTVSEDIYMERILQEIANQISKEISVNSGAGYVIHNPYENDYEYLRQIFLVKNFYLKNNSLVLYFDKYSLKAGADGTQSYEIPYDYISDILAINPSIE